jgi:hypothetical protein
MSIPGLGTIAMALWAAMLLAASAPAWGWAMWVGCSCITTAIVRAAR